MLPLIRERPDAQAAQRASHRFSTDGEPRGGDPRTRDKLVAERIRVMTVSRRTRDEAERNPTGDHTTYKVFS